MGGITSSFRFEGYKIDRINYETINSTEFIEITKTLDPSGWRFAIGIKNPLFFKSLNKYVGGMDIKITYPLSKNQSPEDGDETKNNDKEIDLPENIVKLEIGVAGIFAIEDGRLEKATEENLVKLQIPMLLFPYLRAAITSIFASCGVGPMILPLINVHELAKDADLTITEIE
ncbi:preprotein translocase subunit SecB [Candidatus Magnetoovum chiemensis]|nr:preprotein translocase subunit SecB [Candidatus Magnetoovum chiemensis]